MMDITQAIKVHRIAAQKALTDEVLSQLTRMQKAINASTEKLPRNEARELYMAWKEYQNALAKLLQSSVREHEL